MKTALVAASNNAFHLINELPYILKKGGFHVTVVAFPHWSLTHSSHIDTLIKAPQDAESVLEQVSRIVQTADKKFDLIILGTDHLIWTLADRPIPASLKKQLSPVKNLDYASALEGKIGVAALCARFDILTPASRVAHSREEARSAAQELGFPVMLKISRSGAGDGVLKCDCLQEVEEAPIAMDKPFLVQKYISGDLISVEPLFLGAHLAAYAYSIVTHTPKPFQPSIQRTFTPCSEVEPILKKLGQNLQMTGFANISFIREYGSQKHYLFELDFRPNRWVRYGGFAGVDWAKAMKNPSPLPPEKPQYTKHLRHFPSDLNHAIQSKNFSRIFYWLRNKDGAWKALPLYDPPLLFWGFWHIVKKTISLFTSK